jgi:hypothetical protein
MLTEAASMNKTIYIRDEDVSVWERARELAGDKLAPIIMTGLKRFIAEREAQEAAAKGFERIELEFNDADDHFIPKIKAFNGRWIIPKTKPHKVTNEDGDRQWSYSLALTLKGSTVVYWIDEDREGRAEHFRVFSSLRAAAEDREVNSVARRAIKEMGIQVEELDI